VSGRRSPPKAVRSPAAPAPIGPYSQALESAEWLFCSGQIGLDARTGELVAGGIREEARQALENLEHVLREAGLGFGEVVKTTLYLVELAEFAAVNEIYAEFVRPPYPARATVGVAALPRGARVEVEAIARRSS
jgi:2-iminobutanoate/2-iminopropanoate deaminase